MVRPDFFFVWGGGYVVLYRYNTEPQNSAGTYSGLIYEGSWLYEELGGETVKSAFHLSTSVFSVGSVDAFTRFPPGFVSVAAAWRYGTEHPEDHAALVRDGR